ncbi:hypothetical protein CYLTODRAFT_492741 [Cylindrobasidium torrendii FP15055 ss-10]|uniref:Uncharacterized protein n=1 Tax=Cylindrobasidium torrendii FP15055 ss-10 TaxID=1314674 RepID=A0A0D7B2T5_9AGAR|nr:hypothetical protein CYLTODRAFT_492741 [Cylindrobasidium torrendii FP15055 ss-10]
MGGKVKRRPKGSPTWVRNCSERRNLNPLTAAVRKRVKAMSPFKDAGALTGKHDPCGMCQMCHVAPRNGRVVVYFRFSKLCNEILHVDSSSNIFLEFADEHGFNDFLYNNLSPTRDQWTKIRDFLEHNFTAPPDQRKKLFDVMRKGTLWRYKLVFNNREGTITLYFDPDTGDWTPNSPRIVDTETTAFEITPWMAQHLIWVVIARVDACTRLESAGRYHEANFDKEQLELDADMKRFCEEKDLLGPMTLEEYREMIACGWINADDEKNYRKCRGEDREVPLYDPQTGQLVNTYRGKDAQWPRSVDPSIVGPTGELLTDDTVFSDEDAVPALEDDDDNDDDEDEDEPEITYDSTDEDTSPRLPRGSIDTRMSTTSTQGPVHYFSSALGRNSPHSPGPSAARDSRSSPDTDSDPEPRSSPTPAQGYRQRKKARLLSPRASPTCDDAPAAESTNPSRRRGPLQRRPTRATAPVSPEPLSPSLLSSDPLDLINHPSSPHAPTVDLSSDPLDTLTRHQPSTSNARAGPSTLATSGTRVLQKPASKRYNYFVPAKAVQRPTRNRSGVASGSKQRTGKKKSVKTGALKKGKRKREEEDEDEEDET